VRHGVPLLTLSTILILRSGNAASRRRDCKRGACRKITLRDAALLRVREYLSNTSSPRTLIRGPGRQARLVPVALRGSDEKLRVNRRGRREGAKGAEALVRHGVPLLTLSTILILRSGNAASRRRDCKRGACRKITLRDAALLRVREYLSNTSSPRTLIRGPGRQARLVPVALRGSDEKLRVNRRGRREGAKGAEALVRHGVPLLTISTILILRRRIRAVSKEGL
jgi:hypothetical protein